MDERIRRLERQVAQGDYEARRLWKHDLARLGEPDPDQAELEAPLTEWEATQEDYDDIAWQSRPWLGLIVMYCGYGCCGYRTGLATKLVKAQDFRLKKNPLAHNSKRKTLRTHRDDSRGRNVRPRQ